MTPGFECIVIKNKVSILKDAEFREWLLTLPNKDRSKALKKYRLFILPEEECKSRSEEEYYWSVLVDIWSKHYGDTILAAHEQLLAICAPRIKGLPKRTRGLNYTKQQYHDYIFGPGGVVEFMVGEGCKVPMPGETWEG